MKVGIIGCGFIGTELAQFIDKDKNFRLIGLNDIDKNKVNNLIKNLKSYRSEASGELKSQKSKISDDSENQRFSMNQKFLSNNKPRFMILDDLIKKSDLIVESATKNIVKEILSNKNLDKKNKKLLVMSTGGLISNLNLLNKIKNCRILLPSGAIAGLDAIKSASGKIKSLTLTTTKPVKGLEGAPYIIKNNIELNNLKNKIIIFEGNLKDSIEGFPQNINVAATLFLASNFKDIKIKIVADPNTKFNMHEINAEGDFGIIKATTINFPSKNPKTSYLAVLSAMQTIKNLKNNVKIGT